MRTFSPDCFMKCFAFILSSILIVASTHTAQAAARDPYDLPEQVAIQGRKYQMNHSIFGSAGYMPIDSFNRAFSFSGGYRYAIRPWLTWEVLSYTQVANSQTQLKKDLEALNLDVKNVGLGGVFDWPKQIYMTGIHYAPYYSKSLMFNSTLVYSETSVFLGAGSLNFNLTGQKPMIAPGLATRMYIGKSFAFNAYFRDYFYKDDNTGITGIFDFGVGLELGFGGTP
jgi:outer membrane beta-barrel protein